jgi:hypothetical protein
MNNKAVQMAEETFAPELPVVFTVFGQLVSSKNRKIQSVKNGRALSFKNPAVVAYEKAFTAQVPASFRNLRMGSLERPLCATITVYYQSARSDLDVNLVYDLLQPPKVVKGGKVRNPFGAGVIEDDRYIRRKVEAARVDKENPRVEIRLEGL